jgi:hypothetical protein
MKIGYWKSQQNSWYFGKGPEMFTNN